MYKSTPMGIFFILFITYIYSRLAVDKHNQPKTTDHFRSTVDLHQTTPEKFYTNPKLTPS